MADFPPVHTVWEVFILGLSICFLTTSFDIGGAETHILTLAEALTRKGHRVCVISAGGVYEKRAEGAFRHITLPLNKKRRMLYSLIRLKGIFRRERFDVIHSHARYPSFLCKLLGVRFVSTAHWVFNSRFPLGALTFWGDGTLAVSEDIRLYLEKEYGVRENVLVTVNGIDDERFYTDKEEDGVYRICHASRLDGDRSLAAFLLCEAAEMLYPFYSFSVTIVGDGGDFKAIKKRAEEVNARAGRAVIHLIGASDAVEEYVASADIFVGVSRAALEGMAAECAVILAGNEGYLSVFSPQKSEAAEKTNFCCRGSAQMSTEALARDLTSLLSLPKETLHALGKANRAYVQKHYSAEKMASDALALYKKAMKKKAVLLGYYGYSNVGDTLMHRALTLRLRREGYAEVLTLSQKKFSLSSLYAIYRGYDFFLGGGNLLQDESSYRSLWFYLSLTRFALKRGSRVSLLSSGFGPLSAKGERAVRSVLSRAALVECRTSGDCAYAKSLGALNVISGHDAVLDLPLGVANGEKRHILLAFRTPKNNDERLRLFSFFLHLRRMYGEKRLLFFAMHPRDAGYLKKVSSLLESPFKEGSVDDFLFALKGSLSVYADRLHAGVCALKVGVPAFLMRGDEKAERFAFDVSVCAESLSLPSPILLFSPDAQPPLPPSVSSLSSLCIVEKMKGNAKKTES